MQHNVAGGAAELVVGDAAAPPLTAGPGRVHEVQGFARPTGSFVLITLLHASSSIATCNSIACPVLFYFYRFVADVLRARVPCFVLFSLFIDVPFSSVLLGGSSLFCFVSFCWSSLDLCVVLSCLVVSCNSFRAWHDLLCFVSVLSCSNFLVSSLCRIQTKDRNVNLGFSMRLVPNECRCLSGVEPSAGPS